MTGKTRVEARNATAEDVRRFYGKPLAHTFRGRVVTVDGEPAGIVGWYLANGRAFVFSEVREALKPFKTAIWREAINVMQGLKLPGVCVADPSEPGAEKFLRRLGWRHVGRSVDGEVYEWPIR